MFLVNAWYVGAWSNEVTTELFQRTIIGESVLMYRKKSGEAVALGNRCPHRFAPLHKGKLDGDVVECPYHGLKFDASGQCVHNPHGDGKIPKKAAVKTYPLVERHDMLWLWMGDPALADAATIPDFSCQTDPNFPTVGGVVEMEANYTLLIDNLMDLTHAQYLHFGLLNSPDWNYEKPETIQDGTTVWSNNWLPNGTAPPAWGMMMGNYKKPVDHWQYIRWDAPAHMLLDVGITPTGQSRHEGVWVYGTDILTPKDNDTTYYFWAVSRNHGLDDPEVGKAWEQAIELAFAGQDKPMVEDVHAMMGGESFEDLDPVLLATDAGPIRCRRLLAKLIDDQEIGQLAEPGHKALEELRELAGERRERVEPFV
jgi:phenylpropionate dioxygenase-like ring-hydroxylating dioxygenase large terminal subunit